MSDLDSSIKEYQYLWTTEKELWLLKQLKRNNEVVGYLIINEIDEMMLMISDPDVLLKVVEKLIGEGVQTTDEMIDD